MSEKKTIYVSDPIERAIKSFKNVSNRLSKVCDRYTRIVHLADPLNRFTEQEFLFLCDEFNGSMWEPASQIRPLYIYCEIKQDAEAKEQHWKVDISDLQSRLNNLTMLETIALIEAIELFWTPLDVVGMDNWSEVLKERGFKFKES